MKEMFRGTLMRVTIAVVAIVAILIATVAINVSKKSTGPQPGSGGEVTIIEPDETPLADAPVTAEDSSNGGGSDDQKASVEEASQSSDDGLVASAGGVGSAAGIKQSSNGSNNTGDNTVVQAVNTGDNNRTSNPANAPASNAGDASEPEQNESGSDESGSSQSGSNQSGSNQSGSSDNNNNSQSGANTPSQGSQTPSTGNMSKAEQYYSETSTIVRIIDADTSEDTLTENEAQNLLAERGFTAYPITYEYAMGGEFKDDETTGSDIRRPMYETDFISENGELWHIFVINGAVMTNPVSYNLNSTRPVLLLLSESKELTSYNSETNKYFVTVPFESTMVVKVVDRIDADTLNEITSEEIDGL